MPFARGGLGAARAERIHIVAQGGASILDSQFQGGPNPGQQSGEPRLHVQEEVVVVKEGTVEATYDGHSETVGPGSVIFFASGATTRLRNTGKVPCTYTVIYYYTPLTPKK